MSVAKLVTLVWRGRLQWEARTAETFFPKHIISLCPSKSAVYLVIFVQNGPSGWESWALEQSRRVCVLHAQATIRFLIIYISIASLNHWHQPTPASRNRRCLYDSVCVYSSQIPLSSDRKAQCGIEVQRRNCSYQRAAKKLCSVCARETKTQVLNTLW